MEKVKIITIKLDAETLKTLDHIAKEYEGNRSMAIRYVLRKAAKHE